MYYFFLFNCFPHDACCTICNEFCMLALPISRCLFPATEQRHRRVSVIFRGTTKSPHLPTLKVYLMIFFFILFLSIFPCLDEDEEPRCVQLTNQHKTAIRFIRKVIWVTCRRPNHTFRFRHRKTVFSAPTWLVGKVVPERCAESSPNEGHERRDAFVFFFL